jgi:hypothetical protein
MLSLAPGRGYIHEPLNLTRFPATSTAPVRYWFQYIAEHNEAEFIEPLGRTLAFRFPFRRNWRRIGSARDLRVYLQNGLTFAAHRIRRSVPIVKDPLALLSADWMSDTFGMPVVVLIRHPAAFVASLLRAGWTHPFSHFVQQPELMERKLSRYAETIREFAEDEKPLEQQAALLWLVLHECVRQYRESRPDWLFLRHEDLSRDPIEQFRSAYRALGMTFSGRAEAGIRRYSEAGARSARFRVRKHLKRDSRGNVAAWKQRLSPEQIRCVRERTEPLWPEFYGAGEW